VVAGGGLGRDRSTGAEGDDARLDGIGGSVAARGDVAAQRGRAASDGAKSSERREKQRE
jgi:hypothetical protein